MIKDKLINEFTCYLNKLFNYFSVLNFKIRQVGTTEIEI